MRDRGEQGSIRNKDGGMRAIIGHSICRAFCAMSVLVFAMSAQAASFDCSKASTKIEHMICDNTEISTLDGILGKDYQYVLNKAKDDQKKRVIAEQKHWLKFTRNVCGTITCLKHAYWSRQAELETFFEPKSQLYAHASDKAGAIKQILANSPLYPSYDTPFCHSIFDDLKNMKDVQLVDPVAQAQSYEDPAFDKWKKQCGGMPPFNFAFHCMLGPEQEDADSVMEDCYVGYGLPPFKLYELPSVDSSRGKRYFFYADEAYGPMNKAGEKPLLGGAGLAGFQQININQCLSGLGNRWDFAGKKSTWLGVHADADQGGLNGKNYNSIIKYRGRYYFFILHKVRNNYWLDIEPTAPSNHPTVCQWSHIKQ